MINDTFSEYVAPSWENRKKKVAHSGGMMCHSRHQGHSTKGNLHRDLNELDKLGNLEVFLT